MRARRWEDRESRGSGGGAESAVSAVEDPIEEVLAQCRSDALDSLSAGSGDNLTLDFFLRPVAVQLENARGPTFVTLIGSTETFDPVLTVIERRGTASSRRCAVVAQNDDNFGDYHGLRELDSLACFDAVAGREYFAVAEELFGFPGQMTIRFSGEPPGPTENREGAVVTTP